MLTVDIDTGGTMTDALVSGGERRISFKTDTTPHDFTVSFCTCLVELAGLLQYDSPAAFLRDVSIIRWSSTITTNVLGERRGSRLGLLVSAGHEADLYGDGPSTVVGDLIDSENVIGLSADPQPQEILDGVKKLLGNSVRRVCVSRAGAFPDNAVEKRIKEVVEEQYPDHFLGSVPVLLGSEMAQVGHDQTRVHYSLLNAYTHSQLAQALFKAEDILRDDYAWERPLFIGHTSGGVAKVGKTKAVDTIESGPVFGTFGGAYFAREYGIANAVCLDVGGTTSKVSIIRDGKPVFQRGGKLMGIPVQTSFAMLRSMAIGGGSIARVVDGKVTLGPESMGAAPGPACYGLGGEHATLTDAIAALGYLDPKAFLGGRRELDVELARSALATHVGEPLGLSAEGAALAVRDRAAEDLAALVQETLAEAELGIDDTAMFLFGGNGPSLGAFAAEKLGIDKAYAFDLGPVFSAFGSAVSDVAHVYERGVGVDFASNREALLVAARDLYLQAGRDLRGEGFDPVASRFTVELEFGAQEQVAGSARFDTAQSVGDDWFGVADQAVSAAGIDTGRWPVLLLRLMVRHSIGTHELQKSDRSPRAGAGESRAALFAAGQPEPQAVHRWEALGPGSEITGPAIINGATLTCPLPPGWALRVDDYGNAVMRREQKL